ncbi:unnamed protein product [Brassica oleracea]
MISISRKESKYKAKQNTLRNRRKKLKNYCPQQACKLSVLPDDIIMDCLAIVSRLEHESLFLVSKLHRSLMLSPELYQARSLMGCTELCSYLSSGSIFSGGPWLRYLCHWWDDCPEAIVQGLFPGFSISYVDQSPFHGVSLSFCCSWCGGREDICLLRLQGTTFPHMGRDNVIYGCVTGGWILWCEASELESGVMKWRQVMGLEDLRDTLCASKLVNYGWGLPSEHLDAMLPGPTCYSSGTVLLIGNARFGVQRSPYRGGRKQARFGQLLSGLKQSQLSIVLYISILIITVKFYILYPSIFEISTLFKVSNMTTFMYLFIDSYTFQVDFLNDHLQRSR